MYNLDISCSPVLNISVCDSKIPYNRFFRVLQNLQKWWKCVAYIICVSHFLQFKKVLIENNIEYNIFNNLRFNRDREKSEN